MNMPLAFFFPSSGPVYLSTDGSILLSDKVREKLHKEKGESYADYVWWRGRGKAEENRVSLTFTDNNGVPFQITRTSTGIDTESQANLQRLFQRELAPDAPISSMCRTSLIRDEEITSLSIDLPEADRYRFVRDALGNVTASAVGRRIEGIREILKRRAKDCQEEYVRLRARVSDLTTRLSDTQATIASRAGGSYSMEELHKLFGTGSAEATDILELGRTRVSECRIGLDRLLQLLSRVQQLEQQRKQVGSEAFAQELAELERQLTELQERQSGICADLEQASQVVTQLRKSDPQRAQLTELLDTGDKLGLTSEGKCPLCGSSVSETGFRSHVADSKKALSEQGSEVVKHVAEERELASQRQEGQQRIDALAQQASAHRSRRDQLNQQFAEATAEAHASGITTASDHVSVADVQQHIEQLRQQLQEAEKAVAWLESSSLTDLVESLQRELEEAKEQSQEASHNVTRADGAVTKIENARKGVRSVLGEIIDEQLAELSPLIEELYKRLRPHVEWPEFRYRLRGDVRRMLSFEVGEGLNPSFIFSSGQRRATGLAFLLSVHLSRPWCNWKTLVLDDPVQHVDDYRALNLTEVFSAIRKTGRQIVCSVEDEALAALLCRRLRGTGEDEGLLVRMQYDRERGVTVEDTERFGVLRTNVLVPA